MMKCTHRNAQTTWLGRLLRGRRPDRNPLRRKSDVVETAMLAALVVGFIAGAPSAALASGGWMHATAHRVQVEQEASRHQVTAVVLQAVPDTQGGGVGSLDHLTPAWWTAPDGHRVAGVIPQPEGTAAGATTKVWTTRDGLLTDPPLTDWQVASQERLAEMLSVVVLAIVLAITGALARWALDKRRMAAWDADWRATGPRWTART
jgi:hypothetical protein